MKFVYQLDPNGLGLNPSEKEIFQKEGQKGIFETFIISLYSSKYPEGIERPISRRLDSFFRKLDVSENGSLELENAEIDLLKDVLLNDKLKTHPRQARYYNALGRNLEEAIKEQK